jgi:hypothetical protein
MSNTKPQKPVKHPRPRVERASSIIAGEWGDTMRTTYTVGEHVLVHDEVSWAASERITAMLVEADVADILSFNELANRTNAMGLRAALAKAGKTSEFLALVLRGPENVVLAPALFDSWPAWIVEPLVEMVTDDFFTTSPSALSGLRALSMPALALKTARAALTGTSSTPPATAT